VLLKTLDISVSYSCAWTWIAMTIVCACVGSDLDVSVSGGFSLKDTSCAISARVRVWKLPVLLITMGMIWTWILFLGLSMVCLSGSYMLCMLVMVSKMLVFVEYLHFISCKHLLPL
jgi:hypothetical protein